MKAVALLTILLLQALIYASAFRSQQVLRRNGALARSMSLPAAAANIPPEVANQKAMSRYILVERINRPDKSAGGIFLPQQAEGEDRKRLGIVLSIPKGPVYSKKGTPAPVADLAPYQVGDTVMLHVSAHPLCCLLSSPLSQDEWGVGPQHIELGSRRFSFHTLQRIMGVIRKDS